MITKERLQELIEQGATIYDIFKGDIYLVDLTMIKYYDVPKYIEYKNGYYNCNLTRSIEDLFEIREDAEWHLKFGNITRTETMKLPAFELLPKELDIPFIRYNEELESWVLYELYTYNNEICVLFREVYDDASDCLFRKPLNKNNYIEACKLAKKLFLGEVEE